MLRSFNEDFSSDGIKITEDIPRFFADCVDSLCAKKLDPLSSAVLLENTISKIPTFLDQFFLLFFPGFDPVFQLTTDEILPIVLWTIVEYIFDPRAPNDPPKNSMHSRIANFVSEVYSTSLFLTER